MAVPCYESQAKDKLKVTPAVAKAFMNEILEHMKGTPYGYEGPAPKAGGLSYGEALEAVSEKSGLQADTINSILRRDPQVLSRTKQAIARSGDVRAVRNAAEAFADELKGNAAMYEPGNVAKAWDIQRRIALGGHSVVFPWSHMRNWAVQIPTEAGRARMKAFWRAATDVYRYRGVKGQALYEMDMGLMQMSDHYEFFKGAGADIVPGKRTPGDILLANKKPTWSNRNFDSLKLARYSALEDIWSKADSALKEGDTGKAYAATLARDINYATGSVTAPIGEAAGSIPKTAAQLSALAGKSNLLLSSKLFFAKHMDSWMGPLRYIAKGGRMTVAESAAKNIALKRWANTVATHFSILGVNYAVNKMMGWDTPNLYDPTKSDFWRLKVGGVTVPFSPMLEAMRLPIVFTASMVTKNSDEAGTRLWRAAWNAAHPALHTVYEQVSGKDFRGRPVPSARNLLAHKYPALAPTFTKEQRAHPESVTEYLGGKSPIALSGGIHEFYQALKNQGVNPSIATAFIKSAIATAASGLVGQHTYEEDKNKPKPRTVKRQPAPALPPLY